MLQSLFRPVLRPIMMGVMAVTGSRPAWSPLALWPDGIATPGMWISPSLLTASFNDYLGTTPVATPGTVADSVNPVGLALDIRAGATTVSDPGNHMLQATSAARPLESARVNLHTKTALLTAANGWLLNGAPTITSDPDVPAGQGFTNSTKIVTSGVYQGPYQHVLTAGKIVTKGVWLKGGAGGEEVGISDNGNAGGTVTLTADWAFYEKTWTVVSDLASGVLINASGQTVYIAGIQTELGSAATSFQAVNTDSDYDATGITPFQLYDGTDDGMATASFAAGTLTSSMDCMIAVRRDSAANCVAGLYNGVSDATKFFGMAESASGSGCVGSGAGTPTVWVDNTQLTGGTAVTRGTLHTALTAGSYHILEFRNLDLSAWTATGFGLYTSYVFPGARGDIMLYPSTASTEDKDKARQYLADKYGVTLA